MHRIAHIYINGEFVTPHGQEWFDLHNPSTEEVIGQVRLGDAQDAHAPSRRPRLRSRPGPHQPGRAHRGTAAHAPGRGGP